MFFFLFLFFWKCKLFHKQNISHVLLNIRPVLLNHLTLCALKEANYVSKSVVLGNNFPVAHFKVIKLIY